MAGHEPKTETSSSMVRAPCARLSPFIEQLWTSDDNSSVDDTTRQEIVLPTGMAHIVLRLDDSPIRIYQSSDDRGQLFQSSLLSGIRTKLYFKESKSSASVGMLLRPGTLEFMSGKPASLFTNAHLSLESIWDAATIDCLTRQLQQSDSSCARLDLIEDFLKTQLPIICGVHPAITHALARIASSDSIADIVTETGLSHRHFIKLFQSSTGLTPKRYRRINRFNQVLNIRRSHTGLSWAEIAATSSYADQAHLNREFSQIAGITPSRYTKLSVNSAHHLPI